MAKFKIEWTPFIKKPKFFTDVEEEIESILKKSFESQKSIDGTKFPKKKKKTIGRGRKFLWDTGKMVRSLEVEATDEHITISITKGDIYKDYLHERTHWLPLGKELGKKILEIIKKNLAKKGWK